MNYAHLKNHVTQKKRMLKLQMEGKKYLSDFGKDFCQNSLNSPSTIDQLEKNHVDSE